MLAVLSLILLSLLCAFSFASEEAPQTFTLDGRLYSDSAATTPLVDVVSLKVQILDPAQTCIVYEEVQSVNTTSTSGYYTIQIGQKVTPPAGKRSSGDSNNGLTTIFSNSVSGITGKLLSDGTTVCTYNPTAGDLRYVKFTMTPAGDNIARTTTSNLRLDSVPMALVAERAENLRGLTPSQLLQVNGTTASLTQANLENIFSTLNYPNLVSLLATAPANYVLKNSNGSTNIPSVAGAPGSGLAVGQIWYDSTNNQLKYYDGAVKVVGSSTAGTLAATAGGTGQSSFAVGDLLYANTTTALARLPASTSGYVLTSNGAGTTPSWQAAAGGGALSSMTAATTTNSINNANFAQTWNWNSATTESPLTLTSNAITTGSLLTLTSSSAGINSTNGLLNVANSSATTTGTLARFQANSTAGSGVTILNSGNVGIGTTNPTEKLDISGSARLTGNLFLTGGGVSNSSSSSNLSFGFGGGLLGGYFQVFGNNFATSNQRGGAEFVFDTRNSGTGGFNVISYDGSTWTNRLKVSTAGNVGIGTTAPSNLFTIQAVSDGQSHLVIKNASSQVDSILLSTDSSGNEAGVVTVRDGATSRVILSGNMAGDATLFLNPATNKPDGTVNALGSAISILTPNVLNQENGIFFSNGTSEASLPGAAVTSYTSDTGGYGRAGLKFKTSNSGNVTTRMTIDSVGNVGVGTAAPAAKLEVAGEIKVGDTGLACSSTTKGSIRYNNASSVLEFCNGTSWNLIQAAACSDATPSIFTFPDQSNQTTATQVTSSIVQISGLNCSVPVTISGSGSPEFQICSDAGCSTIVQGWTSSPSSIVSGQYVQVRQTSDMAGGASTFATIIIGGTASIWTISTAGGDCVATTPPVGTVCADGSIYVGLSPDTNVKMFTTRCDYGQTWNGSACTGARLAQTWNNGTTNYTTAGVSSLVLGKSNSSTIAALVDASAPHSASIVCESLVENGHSDWYLPAGNELSVLYTGKDSIRNFNSNPGIYYWSSTENSVNNSYAWGLRFSDGQFVTGSGVNFKSNANFVRCARR